MQTIIIDSTRIADEFERRFRLRVSYDVVAWLAGRVYNDLYDKRRRQFRNWRPGLFKKYSRYIFAEHCQLVGSDAVACLVARIIEAYWRAYLADNQNCNCMINPIKKSK